MASVTCVIDGRQKEFALEGEITTVGRSHEADIRFRNDRTISRLQFQFLHRADGYYVEQLSPKTKTRVRGKPIPLRTPEQLHDGDDVEFGNQRMVFSARGGVESPSLVDKIKGLFGR